MDTVKSTYLILLMSMALLLSACDGGEVCRVDASSADVELYIGIPGSGGDGSRTSSDSDPEYQVNDLTLYFFKATDFSESGSPAVWKYEMPAAMGFNGAADGGLTLAFPFPMEVKSGLFAGESSCYVYALANTRGGLVVDGSMSVVDSDNPTVAQLRSVVSQARFSSGTPSEFLMDALVSIPYADGRLSGDILLERLACRITMTLSAGSVAGSVDPGRFRAWISNGADMASLDGDIGNVRLYSHDPASDDGSGFSADGQYVFVMDNPFYSYPRACDNDDTDGSPAIIVCAGWTDGSGSAASRSTTLSLSVLREIALHAIIRIPSELISIEWEAPM